MAAAKGEAGSYHNLGYAWEALKRCGHTPRPENEKVFMAARNAMISDPTEP